MNNLNENIKWQHRADSIPGQVWDVIIVGAGPAGAIAACHLAARHHRILLLERKQFPREKVCGDGLLPDALRCLDTIGVGKTVRAAGHPVSASVLFSPSLNEVEIPGEYLTLKRSLLDMIVAQKAVDMGAFFACGEVKQLAVEPDGLVSFTVHGGRKPIRSRIGVVATGANIRLLRKLNWPARKEFSAVGLRCYVRSSFEVDRFIISLIPHNKSIVPGYGWIFPMGDHEYNVGYGITLSRFRKHNINLKRKFNSFIDDFPLATELLRQSDRITDLRAAALRYDFDGVYPFVDGPIIAAGETIGTTTAFMGEGVGKAMESGQLAAEAISEALESDDLAKLSLYNQQMESKFKTHYPGYRVAEKWLARPRLNDFILGRFGKSRHAKEILAGVIAETNNPQEIFSLKGVIKSFWK